MQNLITITENNLNDKFCDFINKYKQCVVEPSNRGTNIIIMEKIASEHAMQKEKLNKMEEELTLYKKKDKERISSYNILMKSLKEDINELIKCVYDSIDDYNSHKKIDSILDKTYSVIKSLDKIPESI